MNIEIINAEQMEEEHFNAALRKALQYTCEKARIHVSPRNPADAPEYKDPGWIEYGIHLEYKEGGRMYVACIQRKPGEPVEFHS